VPELGLAITDETGDPTRTTMQFERGKITWTPWTGSNITWAPTFYADDRPDDHSADNDNNSAATRKSAGGGAEFGKRSA